jgi:nitroreductase
MLNYKYILISIIQLIQIDKNYRFKIKKSRISMNVSEVIRFKRAVRSFSGNSIPEEIILVILNAGRRAQSSKNSQPWNFIAITDRDILRALSECGYFASHLSGAALGVAIVHPDPGEKFQLMFDIGQAAAYMQLAAWELGVGSCLASIYQPDKAREILGFPQDTFLRIAISFGYPQDTGVLTKTPVKGGRRPIEEIIHWNKW